MLLGVFDPSNPFTWVQGGAIAAAVMAVVVMFVKGWIVPGHVHRAVVDANEALAAENRAIHARLEGEVFDALKAAAIAVSTQNEIVRDMLRRG